MVVSTLNGTVRSEDVSFVFVVHSDDSCFECNLKIIHKNGTVVVIPYIERSMAFNDMEKIVKVMGLDYLTKR